MRPPPVWQGMRTEIDQKNFKLLMWADELLCLFGAVWWIIAGVLLSIWTSEANAIGLPKTTQRNGYCTMAW
jgi:hypothetical protein